MWNKCWYCLTNAFFGKVKIARRAFLSNGDMNVTIGIRPINSGINPKLFKSEGVI